MSKKVRKCVLCGKPLKVGEYGNNPEPVCSFSAGVCCNDCNMNTVLPARLAALRKQELRNAKEKECTGSCDQCIDRCEEEE